MAQVYSTTILADSGSDTTVVPAGLLFVIRDISGTLSTLGIDGPQGVLFNAEAQDFYFPRICGRQQADFHRECRVVCNPGSVVSATLHGDGLANYIISGYALTLP